MKQLEWGVADNLRETTAHGTPDFPIAIYLTSLETFPQRSTLLHWHDELQFVMVRRGSIDYTVEDHHYALRQRDILFINSRCLHMASQTSEQDAEYICINVHHNLIGGNHSSLIYRKYVLPIIETDSMNAVLIRADDANHRELNRCLNLLISFYESSDAERELYILRTMIDILLLLIKINPSSLTDRVRISAQDQQRIDKIIGFIQDSYSEKLTLADIAAVISCSPEECCRLFNRTVNQSPVTYLNSFRILKSLTLLTETQMSIADIAQEVGFGSSSYYTEKFKAIMNCRPLEYRKRYAKSAHIRYKDLNSR